MYRSLKERYEEIEEGVIGTRDYYSLTPTSLSLMPVLEGLAKKYAKGRLLDAGAGRLTHKMMLVLLVDSYLGLDKFIAHPELDLTADLLKGLPFKDESFDTVFCSQVLEHLSDPKRALGEMARILKKEGHLILSAPHLSYIHGAPEDFFRFTCYGLKALIEEVGLEVVEIKDCGGMLSFCLTPLSMISLILGYRFSWTKRPTLFLNRCCSKMVVTLDNLIDRYKIYALNYVVVGRK